MKIDYKSFRSGINKFVNAYRYIITAAAAISIILSYMVGAFAFAAMTDEKQSASREAFIRTEPNAIKLLLDGEETAIASKDENIAVVIEEICSELSQSQGMEAKLVSSLETEAVCIDDGQAALKKDEIKEAITARGDFKYIGYALMVDGKEIGLLKTREELTKVLDKIKEPYLKRYKEVTFAEDVQIVEKNIIPEDINTTSDEIFKAVTKDMTGQEDYIVKQGDTIWDIALKYDTDEESIYKLNPELSENDYLMIDQKIKVAFPLHIINVVTAEVIQYEAEVPYKTEKKENNSLYTNQTKILKEGKEGIKKVQAKVYKKNGIEQNRDILKETIIKEPVNAVVSVGTREIPRSVSRSGGALNWPAAGSITSRFGWRWGRMHAGIDIANSAGTPVYAADPGTVIFSGYKGGYGKLVILDHGGGGFTTYYGHLQSSAVSVGETLARGELLGFMGSTGDSTGNHVHFEVRLHNQPMDPLRYLN